MQTSLDYVYATLQGLHRKHIDLRRQRHIVRPAQSCNIFDIKQLHRIAADVPARLPCVDRLESKYVSGPRAHQLRALAR